MDNLHMNKESEEALTKNLKLACDGLGIRLPAVAIALVQTNSGYDVNLIDLLNHCRQAEISEQAKVGTKEGARNAVQAWFPENPNDCLIFLEEASGYKQRRWVLFDLATLAPRLINDGVISVIYRMTESVVA